MKTVDLFAKNLQTAMKDRNLTEIVDIVFVSDHGMADISNPEWVYIDDYLAKKLLISLNTRMVGHRWDYDSLPRPTPPSI